MQNHGEVFYFDPVKRSRGTRVGLETHTFNIRCQTRLTNRRVMRCRSRLKNKSGLWLNLRSEKKKSAHSAKTHTVLITSKRIMDGKYLLGKVFINSLCTLSQYKYIKRLWPLRDYNDSKSVTWGWKVLFFNINLLCEVWKFARGCALHQATLSFWYGLSEKLASKHQRINLKKVFSISKDLWIRPVKYYIYSEPVKSNYWKARPCIIRFIVGSRWWFMDRAI